MVPHTDILKILRTRPMSLADLQQATQVSLPTLRKAVQDLVDAQWIRIVGQAGANGGRPPNMFGLDDSHYVLIGVHLQLPACTW
ncbi:MAG: winged helix-turn-helix transcriptional regulator [Chloroflexi bacterium]|nr:winged helix-turn-helix transcriptional regulator [Chloroflexota bacterium]